MQCSVCNLQNVDSATVCRACGAALAASVAAPSSQVLAPGTRLKGGAFSVGKVLGQGGFGITYLGADVTLGRSIAIKEFFPNGCVRQSATVQPGGVMTIMDYQHARGRFLDEARTLARFQHPGIVQVYASFEENNTAYMTMELVKGRTLQSLIEERGLLPEDEAVGYVVQAGEALAVVHGANLLHRDVKPDNLMVAEGGRVVLLDFGTAREFASGKTKRMTAMLTPGYAPLEQYGQQAKFGAYTEVYALAATLYHALTGEVPVQATDRATGVELQPPNRLVRSISRNVSDAIMWAMERKATSRPQSVVDFIQALQGGLVEPDVVHKGTPGDATSWRNPHDWRIKQILQELRWPQQQKRSDLEAELAGLFKESLLLGAVPPLNTSTTIALRGGELVRWNAPSQKLRQRSSQGTPYWDPDGDGTLLVTSERILFAFSTGTLWERPLAKLSHVSLKGLPFKRLPFKGIPKLRGQLLAKLFQGLVDFVKGVPIVVTSFHGLKKPIAFVVPDHQIEVTLSGHTCNVTLQAADLIVVVNNLR